jgi:ketosteroid isomerase-like protein
MRASFDAGSHKRQYALPAVIALLETSTVLARWCMFKLIVLATVAGALALPAGGVTTAMEVTQLEGEGQHVLAVEDEWISAEINRDEATLRRVIDDRFVFNSSNGRTSGKADLIKNILGWKMTGQTVSERTVLVDGDTAVVFGTTELRFASEAQEDTKTLLRYTATYVKRGGRWRALALQMAKREGAQ